MNATFGWTDIEEIAINLHETHAGVDPFAVKFTDLRRMIEELDGFEADTDHQVNEQILEAIQVAWRQEIDDLKADEDEDASGYEPNQPYR